MMLCLVCARAHGMTYELIFIWCGVSCSASSPVLSVTALFWLSYRLPVPFAWIGRGDDGVI
jgi:hypothetical protein